MTEQEQGVEPLVLVVQGSDKVAAHACGKCRIIARDEAQARQCCAPYLCKRCGAKAERFHAECPECQREVRAANRRATEDAHLAAATVVPAESVADVMLYDEENDRWLQAGDDPEDWGHEPPTRYAFVGVPQRWRPSAEHFLDQLADGDWDEEAADRVSSGDIDELDAFLDAWSERVNVVSYFPDYKRVVVFDAAISKARGGAQ